MSVVETIYPDGTVGAGSWTAVGDSPVSACVDETGSHDGDTTYADLLQSDTGTTTSTFEVSLPSPSTWVAMPQVRDGENWKTSDGEISPRNGETWEATIHNVRVRDGEAWKFGIPQVVVRCTAKRNDSDPAVTTFVSGTLNLLVGATVLGSAALSLTAGSYVETVLTVNASEILAAASGCDPTDLRVSVEGVCQSDTDGETADLRVTQIKVELND